MKRPDHALPLMTAVARWTTVLVGLLMAQGTIALALVLVARRVTPLEYGQYLSSYALTALLVLLPGFGMDSWLLARDAMDRHQLAQSWLGAFHTRLRLLALWPAGLAGLALVLPADAFPLPILSLTALGLAGESMATLSYAALRNSGLHEWVTACQSVGGLVLLGVTLALPLAPGGIALFAAGRALVSVAMATVAVLLTRYHLQPTVAPTPTHTLFRKAQSYFLAELSTSVYLRADLVLVAIFLGVAGSSVYGPAASLLGICFLAPNALYLLVVPILARAYRRTPSSYVRIGVVQVTVQVVIGAALSAALFWLAPAIVDLIFGPAYRASAAILRLLSILLTAKSLSFGLGAVLTTAGWQSWRTTVQMAIAVFNVTANLAVIGVLGITGVSIVYVVSEVLLCAGYCLGTYRWWRTHQSWGVAAR